MFAQMKIVFQTPNPMRQEDGLKFWEIGSHFTSLPGKTRPGLSGPRVYQLTSAGEAESLPDAVEGLCAQITQICDEWPRALMFADGSSVKFLSITAEDGGSMTVRARSDDDALMSLGDALREKGLV